MKRGWISQEFIIKSSKNRNNIIAGYASVFDVADSQNDIVAKGAFKNTSHRDVRLLWQHDITKPIGVITSLEEDEYGLKMEAEINNSTSLGAEVSSLIKQKAVSGLSVGFSIKSSNYNKLGNRIIEEVELMEISVVTFPANSMAEINNIKYHSNDMIVSDTSLWLEVKSLLKQIEKY
ncbi:MAG: HK97 family phage prohead protease [Rickettsiales bacterium]|nr:HK97 family phage prohead protease [Rickettsiales bacterium]